MPVMAFTCLVMALVLWRADYTRAASVLMLLSIWGWLATRCSRGIATGDSGNVSYVQGEMCTINSTPDRSVDQFMADAMWCVSQHKKFILSNP